MRIKIKNANFNAKLICWFNKYNENGSYVLTIQPMGSEVQLIGYGTAQERDADYERLLKI